jgi:5,10-methylenetetrahydrofolate reductase
MNQNVAGINIPDSFIEILERSADPKRESIAFCAEVVEKLKPYSNAFHFMPVAMESRVGILLDRCFSLIES